VAQDLSNLLEVLELLETNETLAVNLAEVPMRGVFGTIGWEDFSSEYV